MIITCLNVLYGKSFLIQGHVRKHPELRLVNTSPVLTGGAGLKLVQTYTPESNYTEYYSCITAGTPTSCMRCTGKHVFILYAVNKETAL